MKNTGIASKILAIFLAALMVFGAVATALAVIFA